MFSRWLLCWPWHATACRPAARTKSSTPCSSYDECPGATASSANPLTEGIPPVPLRLIDKIRRWEFVELGQLLMGAEPAEGVAAMMDGHIVPSRPSQKEPANRRFTIMDISSWLQAYARFMAILVSSPATSKEEAAGLAAHQHIILQLAQDLGGHQWMAYVCRYKEWAAAKSVRIWGKLNNLSIYGKCLPRLARPTTLLQDGVPQLDLLPVCFKWNAGNCQCLKCRYMHVCVECRGPH